jgi:cytochrome c peroxidase
MLLLVTTLFAATISVRGQEIATEKGTVSAKKSATINEDSKLQPVATSYMPIAITESFEQISTKKIAEKQRFQNRQNELLKRRYDISDNPISGVVMSRGKAIQQGVRVKLPANIDSWESLAKMSPDKIKAEKLWPEGFLPLPHPIHETGGMVFPQFQIDEILKQEIGRDLNRYDIAFDLPDHFLPEFPPAIYLTTRPDLGDVSQGEIVTFKNYYRLFNGILNPKQLEGLRLLVTPFQQQNFNTTEDRLSLQPQLGVTCFDCHTNGHTNGATHLVGDIRPTELRHRLDTPSLRGVNVQQIFGSQRALKTIEDFTEFEQRAAYFDGDIVIATKKGVNILERGSQSHFMAEFQQILDFPPAPKLDIFGNLDAAKVTKTELAGEEIFNGKGRCVTCHPSPYYTDGSMHSFQTSRFFEPVVHNGPKAIDDGSIKIGREHV